MYGVTPAEHRGLRIKRARERMGWTQEQLGSHVGVSKNTVGNWERGRTNPKNRTGAVEAVLGISLSSPEQEAEVYTDPAEAAIWEDPRLPADVRRDAIAGIRRLRREHASTAEKPPA